MTPLKSRWRTRRSEAGDTLIEILVAILILSFAGLALMEGFSATISGSAQNRSLAANDSVLRAAAETAFTMIEQQATPQYSVCATSSIYNDDAATANIANYGAPSGYTASIGGTGDAYPVEYWSSGAWTSTPPACTSSPVPQQITMAVYNSNGTSETTTFVVSDLNVGSGASGNVAVSGVSPGQIYEGTSQVKLTVTGLGFANDASVSFSNPGIGLISTTWHDASTLYVTVNVSPSAATGSVAVTVTNTNEGTSGTGTGYLSVLAAPTVVSVWPTNVSLPASNSGITTAYLAQGGSEQFTLYGTQFVDGMTVTVTMPGGGASGVSVTSSVTVTSLNTATFMLSASSGAQLATADVFNVTLPGGGTDSNPPQILQILAPPSITGVTTDANGSSPCDLGFNGTGNCTVTGTGFQPGALVSISSPTVGVVNNVVAYSPSLPPYTSITFNASGNSPSGASPGATADVTVTNPDGTSWSFPNGFANG